MTANIQQPDASHRTRGQPCLALTPEVLTHLQVCLSSVELLDGVEMPAMGIQAVQRISRDVDGLVAAVAAARRSAVAQLAAAFPLLPAGLAVEVHLMRQRVDSFEGRVWVGSASPRLVKAVGRARLRQAVSRRSPVTNAVSLSAGPTSARPLSAKAAAHPLSLSGCNQSEADVVTQRGLAEKGKPKGDAKIGNNRDGAANWAGQRGLPVTPQMCGGYGTLPCSACRDASLEFSSDPRSSPTRRDVRRRSHNISASRYSFM